MQIETNPRLTRRVALDESSMIATVHLCSVDTCRLCPGQTAETVRAELEAAMVLADPDVMPDWDGIATAVAALRPRLERALCSRMLPGLDGSLGVPADLAETSEVLPSLPGLPLAEALGGATTTLLAPVRGTRDTSPIGPVGHAIPHRVHLRHPQVPDLRVPDDPTLPNISEPAELGGGHTPEGRWIVRNGWARTALLAAIIVGAAVFGGPAMVRTITAPAGDAAQNAGGARGDQQGAARQEDTSQGGGGDRAGGTGPAASGSAKASASPSAGAVLYANCAAAVAAGAAPILRGQPGYRDPLDRDRDGIACEQTEADDPTIPDPGGNTSPSQAPPDVTDPTGGADPSSPPPPPTTAPPAPTSEPSPTPAQTTAPPPDPGQDCVVNALGLCVTGGGINP